MEKERAQLIDEISQIVQRVAHTEKFVPGVWLELDLTFVQLKSLFFIDFEGSTNFKNLAVALGVTPPSVTGIIDRLFEQGLVSREENPENRRMQVLRTTAKGKELLAKLLASRRSKMSLLLEQLSLPDLTELARILALVAKSTAFTQDKAIDEGSID